jgi:hypothetical protein
MAGTQVPVPSGGEVAAAVGSGGFGAGRGERPPVWRSGRGEEVLGGLYREVFAAVVAVSGPVNGAELTRAVGREAEVKNEVDTVPTDWRSGEGWCARRACGSCPRPGGRRPPPHRRPGARRAGCARPGATVRRGQGYTLRVSAVLAVHRQLLARHAGPIMIVLSANGCTDVLTDVNASDVNTRHPPWTQAQGLHGSEAVDRRH